MESFTAKIAYIDDNPLELRSLKQALVACTGPLQFAVDTYLNREDFLQSVAAENIPDLALIDIHLGKASGLELAREVKANFPEMVTIIRSSDNSHGMEAAVAGVDDYLAKDKDTQHLLERLSFHAAAIKTRRYSGVYCDHASEGVGSTIETIKSDIPRINASAVSSVHIFGETGVGKEVVARLFKPSVTIDCGALPENIVESELFGHKRGAFTGATQDQVGLLDVNDGRWVFLDEIGNIGPKVQAALLRAIGEREIRPIGSRQSKRVNFKLLTATNEDLAAKVAKGEFRADLYQRLTEYSITLKSLRERKNEIPVLIQHFCQNLPGGPYKIEAPALEVLRHYHYENGNIRELRKILVTMTVHKLADGLLPFNAVPESIRQAVAGQESTTSSVEPLSADAIQIEWVPGMKWEEIANDCLLAAIRRTCRFRSYSLRELAPILGLQRSTLSRRLQELQTSGKLNEMEMQRLFKRSAAESGGAANVH